MMALLMNKCYVVSLGETLKKQKITETMTLEFRNTIN